MEYTAAHDSSCAVLVVKPNPAIHVAGFFCTFVSMTIDLIDKLHENGQLRLLIQSGLIDVNVLVWRKVYHLHSKRLEQGDTIMQAKLNAGDTFDKSLSTVYRILEFMNYEPKQKNNV